MENLMSLPVELQVVVLTAGLTEYIKKLLPTKVKAYTPFLAMILGVVLMCVLKQSILMTDAISGLLIGFSTTSLYAIGKDFTKNVGNQ